MALATSNRDGGRTSESGHLRAIMKGLKAQVMNGLNVTQRGAGANMSVDVQIGDAIIPRSDGTYGHPAWADAIYNVAITTADVSNPRRDIVVMYIDYGQTPSTGVSNNTNGVVKIIVVAGTPAGSPSDPSNANIQSAVGASNPYIKLARVRVAAGASSITNSVIDDLRLMASGIQQGGWVFDELYTWTYVSASSFAIAGVDVRDQFPVGTKLALYQSGSIKYFRVADTAFSTNTTITVDGYGTYTLANVPIDKPAFSYMQKPSGYPFPAPFALNVKSASNTGIITPVNGSNVNGAAQGLSLSFNVKEACQALVIITVGTVSSSDFENKPVIFLNGVAAVVASYGAAAGNASSRVNPRTWQALISVPAGSNTISGGINVASATSPSVPVGYAGIAAIVLGNVIA